MIIRYIKTDTHTHCLHTKELKRMQRGLADVPDDRMSSSGSRGETHTKTNNTAQRRWIKTDTQEKSRLILSMFETSQKMLGQLCMFHILHWQHNSQSIKKCPLLLCVSRKAHKCSAIYIKKTRIISSHVNSSVCHKSEGPVSLQCASRQQRANVSAFTSPTHWQAMSIHSLCCRSDNRQKIQRDSVRQKERSREVAVNFLQWRNPHCVSENGTEIRFFCADTNFIKHRPISVI